MKPRADRWLSLLEVADVLAKDKPRVAALSQKRRREYVLRMVRRVEKREGVRLSRRIGREWFVSRNAVDALRKWNPDSLTELGRAVEHLHAKQRDQQRQINDHGSKIRALQEKQRLTSEYVAAIQRVDRRTNAA